MAKAAKRDKFHSEAEESLYELLESVVRKHHQDLDGTAFLILLKHGGWQSKGKHMFGKVQILNDAFRRTMDKDAIIYLNADMWRQLSPPQQIGLLDHQLYGLDTATDRHSNIKIAADGRALLTTRPLDFEGYLDVVKRHGPIMEDIKRLAKALKETNQLTIEDVASGTEQEEKPAAVHEGISGSINPDGTINLDGEQEDKNQLTLDQVAAAAEDPKVTNILDAAKKRSKKDKDEAEKPIVIEEDNLDELPF